jgi:hypothetical protein
MIKKNWAYFLLAFSIVYFVYKMVEKANIVYTKKVVKLDNGFGYNILIKDSVFIEQKIIPGVSGYKNFTSEKDADIVANLVLYKLNNLNQKLPSISLHELDSLGIKY